MNKTVQIFGLVCPFTGKVRFVEIAKNANIAYENLLRAAHLFDDPILRWINILKEKGVKPGCVILDAKSSNGINSKKYWEGIYNITQSKKPGSVENRLIRSKKKSKLTTNMEKSANAEQKRAQYNSSKQNTDSE